MMWYIQLLADGIVLGLGSDMIVNLGFAALVLWAALGGPLRICAILTAFLHLGLALI